MGLSGAQFDRFSEKPFTPNKDRRMAEWRAKKDAERKANLESIASHIARKESEKEENREITGVVKHEPVTTSSEPPPKAKPGATFKKPRKSRKKKENPNQPTLFDGIE